MTATIPYVMPALTPYAPELLARTYVEHTLAAREAHNGSIAAYCDCNMCDDFRYTVEHFRAFKAAGDAIAEYDRRRDAEPVSMTELTNFLTEAFGLIFGEPAGHEAPHNVTTARRPFGPHGEGCDCE